MRTARLLVLAGLIVGIPAFTAAQDSREETIATAQADKAERVTPYVPHPVEQYLLRAQHALIDQPSGFYPYFASVYSGGGFTLGAGYRRFTGDRTHWDIAGLFSAKSYKLLQLTTTSPGHLSGHVDFRVGGSYRDATQVAYYGLGINSPEDLDTAFRMKQGVVGGDITLRPARRYLLTAAVDYEDYTITDPTGDHTPVEDVFNLASAPGLGADPAFIHSSATAAFDSRPAAGYARRGGRYAIAYHNYTDPDDIYSFDRFELDAVQNVPILRENWVLSFHGRLVTTPDETAQVPYFLLPSLGSGSTLRAYSSWRFRDRNSVLFSGEFRWIPNRMVMDMAFFYDTGMVAPTLDAFDVDSFVNNVGIGVRFHTPVSTPLRIDVARGSEGINIVFSSSAAF
jgi:outer membrane protein assembly factor BamA